VAHAPANAHGVGSKKVIDTGESLVWAARSSGGQGLSRHCSSV